MSKLQHNGGTIVIIDDNITNLKVATEYLRAEGLEVLMAKDGQAGIERVKLSQPDLVLLDIQMPGGIDGFETCRLLKADEKTRDIPVIFTTVLTTVEDKLKAFAAGGVDYIPKPFQVEELLVRVNTHLHLQAEIRERKLAESRIRQFVADASHELRTPLTVLGGYLDVLLMGDKDDPEAAEQILKTMVSEVGRLSRLVVDLLTLTRLEANGSSTLQLEKACLADLLRRVQSNFKVIAGNRKLRVNIEPGLEDLDATVDSDQLYQVISNLVDNAIRYTAANGNIQLSLDCVPSLPNTVINFNRKKNNEISYWISLKIQDDGCGIKADLLPFIFDRFYRADQSRDRRTGNAGLGLAISQSIVDAHHGYIQAESVVGTGTTFSIYLPHQEEVVVFYKKVAHSTGSNFS